MYGKTIKEIRKGKNMTLKEAAGESLSASQLSRFENEKSIIPVDLFYEVLDNLNSTTEEFNYIKDQKENNKILELLKKVEHYNNNEMFDDLKTLKAEIKNSRPGIYSWERFIIYFIDSILAIYEDKESTAKQAVLEYLMQVENWGEMELRLYAMFGFVLDVETTYVLMRTALKRSKQYLDVPAASKLLYTILSNNFSTFLSNKNIKYAEETIKLFEDNYSENTEFLTPHIDFVFNKGLLAFVKNDLKKAEEYFKKAITICQLFQQKELEKQYESRYKGWMNNPEYKELIITVR